MEIKNLHSVLSSGSHLVHTIDQKLNITYYIGIFKSISESPLVVGCRALKDAKHIRNALPAVHQNWRNLLLSMKGEFQQLVGPDIKEVRLELWYRVIMVTGSFFCIVGGLGQSLCSSSSQLRVVSRGVDLTGLAFLLAEPFVASRLQEREMKRMKQQQQQERVLDRKEDCKRRPCTGESEGETSGTSETKSFPLRPLSYISRASHAFLFIGRTMHLVEMCAFINHNKRWKSAYTNFERVGMLLSFVSPVKSSYLYLSKRVSLLKSR